jgi:hypothetical protein
MEAFDVLKIAGMEACMKTDVEHAEIAQNQLEEIARLQAEETEWRESRQEALDQIKRRKERRRGGLGDAGEEDVDPEFAAEQEDVLGPEERRRQFDEYRRRTGLTVNTEEDFDGFIMQEAEVFKKRLSTQREEEEETEVVRK